MPRPLDGGKKYSVSFQQIVPGKIRYPYEKNEVGPLCSTMCKNLLKTDERLNCEG
jgi:hypothetical protein